MSIEPATNLPDYFVNSKVIESFAKYSKPADDKKQN